MIQKTDLSLRPNTTGPSASSSSSSSAADNLSASFPRESNAIQGLIGRGKDLLAGLDPRSFPGMKIITDSSGKEWVVS